MPEVFDLNGCKVTFLEFAVPLVCLEAFEDGGDAFVVVVESGRVDENVVEVDNDERIKPVVEKRVHCSLES